MNTLKEYLEKTLGSIVRGYNGLVCQQLEA